MAALQPVEHHNARMRFPSKSIPWRALPDRLPSHGYVNRERRCVRIEERTQEPQRQLRVALEPGGLLASGAEARHVHAAAMLRKGQP
jgi:hypothetical protein